MILSSERIESLLAPYLGKDEGTRRSSGDPQGAQEMPAALFDDLGRYLDLLVKWNERTNLTSIRRPEEIVRRHFGESLFLATQMPPRGSVLDLGSGAGFPGIPVQLFHSNLHVTLAESQNKKASFLRETVRTLNMSTTVWADRAELMPATAHFDVATMRAVDDMVGAVATVKRLANSLYIFSTVRSQPLIVAKLKELRLVDVLFVPDESNRIILHFTKTF